MASEPSWDPRRIRVDLSTGNGDSSFGQQTVQNEAPWCMRRRGPMNGRGIAAPPQGFEQGGSPLPRIGIKKALAYGVDIDR